MSLISPEAEGR